MAIRQASFGALLALALGLAGCGRSDIDTKDADAFVRDCIVKSVEVAGRTRNDPSVVADVVAMFERPPVADTLKRRFEPSRPPRVAGSEVAYRKDVRAACTDMAPGRGRLAGVSVDTALANGLSQWLAVLAAQSSDAKSLRSVIKDAVSGKQIASGRVAELIGRFAPRGIDFKPIRKGPRMLPTITIAAVNPLDKPIEAFFFAVDIKRPDETVMASGRFTFRPPAPLGAGAEANYMIDLSGIDGFTSSELGDVRDKVAVKVKTEDVVSGGVRLLAETIVDPEDGRRIEALGVLLGRIEEVRDFVRQVRERTL